MKGLIVDFDETLAMTDKSVSKGNYEAIEKLINSGKHFAVATGRMTYSAKREILPKLPNIEYISTFNGAVVYDVKNEKTVAENSINSDGLLEILEYTKKRNLYAQIYDEEVITEKINFITDFYTSICKAKAREVGDLASYVKRNNFSSPKVMVVGENIDDLRGEMQDLFKDKFEIARCYDKMYDFTPKGINKGNAVKLLCDVWGIEPSECVAVGDELNDLPMIEFAGVGVAVNNGAKELKEKADYITVNNNDNDAISEVIDKFFKK